MAKISVQDMARAIVGKYGLEQRDAEDFVSAFFDLINEGLHREKAVKVKGLGTFKVIDVRERESVNVNTGERVVIESHGKITFTPDSVMRDLVNKPFAQFETVVLNDGVDFEEIGRVQGVEDNVASESDINETKECEIEDKECLQNEKALTDEVCIQAETSVENNVQNDEIAHDVVDETKLVADVPSEYEYGVDESSVNNCDRLDVDVPSEMAEDEDAVAGHVDGENGFLKRYKGIFITVLLLLVSALAFVGGYYWGRSSVKPIVKTKNVYVVKKPVAPVKTAVMSHGNDTVAADKGLVQRADSVKKIVADVDASRDDAAKPSVKTSSSPEFKNALAIMNTGAYRIVGTDKVITVKRGETLKGLSKFYLGDGMECYIQVHNGIVDVSDGMKLKIPKLKSKLKKK